MSGSPPAAISPPRARLASPRLPSPVAERRRRWSDTYKGVPDSDDEADGKHNGNVNGNGDIDPKLRREERELSKIETGIAQVLPL